MENNSDDETRLIKQFLESKDNGAFIELVTKYIPGIRRILYAILNGNREDVEDAEQEFIMALFKTLPYFNFKSSFKTYIYRIAKNKAIDVVRKKCEKRNWLN